MRTEEEIKEAIEVLQSYLDVTIENFNKSKDLIFQVRGHELEIMINVIEKDRSPAWIYINTIGIQSAVVEQDNILYNSGIKAMNWRMGIGEDTLNDLL